MDKSIHICFNVTVMVHEMDLLSINMTLQQIWMKCYPLEMLVTKSSETLETV